MKLSVKTALAILIFSIAITSSVGYFVYDITSTTLKEKISNHNFFITNEVLKSIDHLMYERYQDIQDFSDSAIFKSYLSGVVGKEDVQQRVDSFSNYSGPWDYLKIVSKDGGVIYHSNEESVISEILINEAEKIAFEKALLGEVYFSDLVISSDTGLPTVYFASPVIVKDDLGEQFIPWVAIGQYSWSAIEEVLSKIHTQTTHAHLFNRDGYVIASGGRDDEPFSINVSDRLFFNLNYDYEKQPPFISSSAISSEAGDSKVVVSFARQSGYREYKGSGWSVLFESPVTESFAPAKKTALMVAFILVVLIFAFMMILYLFLNRFVIHSVKELTETAKAISEGDLNRRAKVISKDEIGQLANSFNLMTGNLVQASDKLKKQNNELKKTSTELSNAKTGLEKKVKERTMELENAKAGLEKQVAERTKELQFELMELERFNNVAVGRELRMVELKKEIESLKKQCGKNRKKI